MASESVPTDGTDSIHYTPPWANTHMIGIAGSSGSGKTTLSVRIVSELNLPWVVILSMDSFYKPLNAEESAKAFRSEYDFDSPDAFDFDILVEKLRDIKAGRKAEIPVYSFSKHNREPQTTTIYSAHVLILEGIFALQDPRVLELLDMKIFVDADADVCLARRLARDVRYRGRDVEGVIKQWDRYVMPNFTRFVEPQKKNSDILIPRGIENTIAINMILRHIRRTLKNKSEAHVDALAKLGKIRIDEPLSENVAVLEQTPQVKGMLTIINDRRTDREEFIFYFDRLATLLIDRAMDQLNYTPTTITTPVNMLYHGYKQTREVSAMVVLRSGGTFEVALRRILPDARIGRILIQSNSRTGEPELHYQKVPSQIAKTSVLIMDPQIVTGAGALMTVRVVKDFGVEEEDIVFVTAMARKEGLRRIMAAFPKIKVVCSMADDNWDRRWVDERYFGC